MKKEAKSQAALEFLTTYAWAFLVILITVGALYYFGIFDFSRFLPQKCLFPSQFECIDFSFVGDEPYGEANDIIKLKLVNNLGEEIRVDSFTVTNDASNPLICSSLAPGLPITSWLPGVEIDFTFSGCTNGVFIVGERTDARITMEYCAPATTGCPGNTTVQHTINGKITAVVNSP
jgi:hypothetical protein|tara:strand:+ start:470 stop:997 length:528 start_codon:yes stop_codon:yes gene_type:complete